MEEMRSFGYNCFGPVMLRFQTWLSEQAAANGVDHLFFLAREGYLLQEYYRKFCSLSLNPNRRDIPCSYLLISRRAVFGALPKTPENIRYIVESGGYNRGPLFNMLEARLGLGSEDGWAMGIDDPGICLPEDNEFVIDLLQKHTSYLNEKADVERATLMEYLKQTGILEVGRAGIVDLGYSGSIQRCLHEICGVPMTGMYFVTTAKVNDWQSPSNNVVSCFGADCNSDTELPVYQCCLALEASLTSPDGQLLKFEPSGQPVFGPQSRMQRSFRLVQMIAEGVKGYFEDVASLENGLDGLDWICQEVMADGLFSERNHRCTSVLSIEDSFCRNDDQSISARLNLPVASHSEDKVEAAPVKVG